MLITAVTAGAIIHVSPVSSTTCEDAGGVSMDDLMTDWE
jgi:hypothetical protein